MLPWAGASNVFVGFVNALASGDRLGAIVGLSSTPLDCFSFGGVEPLSNTEISPPGCHSASCCQYVFVPGPSLKVECLPPNCQLKAPVFRSMSYSAHELRAEINRSFEVRGRPS